MVNKTQKYTLLKFLQFNKLLNSFNFYNPHDYYCKKLCIKYLIDIKFSKKNAKITGIKLKSPLFYMLRDTRKTNYLSFFMHYATVNLVGLKSLLIHQNKLYCFWPIFKRSKFRNIVYLNLLKYLKKIGNKYTRNLLKTFKAFRDDKQIFKFWRFFNKKKIKQKKRGYFFNFHRRQIKIFWKSQEDFKVNYLRPTRFTTRKFKHQFERWYKKNKNFDFSIGTRLASLVTQNFLYFSGNLLHKTIHTKVLGINGSSKLKHNTVVYPGDIISFPANYINYVSRFIVGRFNARKVFKKKNFIYMRNKLSQWRDIKRKTPYERGYNLNSSNRIKLHLEFDIFSANMAFIREPTPFNRFENYSNRHNLEKLNTYKLNV